MINQINRGDIPKCVQVIRNSFLTVAEDFGFTEDNAPRFTAFAVNNERLMWQFEQGRPMFAYYEEGEILGYFSLELKAGGECELNNLCVLPEHRHKRIGEKLLAHAFLYAREHQCRKMFVGIVEENQRLRSWYEVHGFQHVGTEKFDFFPFTCGYMEKELMTREITDKDYEGLMKLYMQLHGNPYPEKDTEMAELWNRILEDKDHHIIVAEKDGRIVSSCVCVIVPNLTHGQRPYALIENVITDEAYRKQGLATACLDYAKELAIHENCYKMMLLTGSKDESTLRFYEEAGYNRRDKTAFIQWL